VRHGLRTRVVGDETVVYDPDTDRTYLLNSSAARVFELCDGKRTTRDILDAIDDGDERSPAVRERVLQSILGFVAQELVFPPRSLGSHVHLRGQEPWIQSTAALRTMAPRAPQGGSCYSARFQGQTLALSWDHESTHAAPGGAICVRSNVRGIADDALSWEGCPGAGSGPSGDPVCLSVFAAPEIRQWLVVRDGELRSQATSPADLYEFLRAEALGILMERLPGAALFPGRLRAESSDELELSASSCDPAAAPFGAQRVPVDTPPLVLVAGGVGQLGIAGGTYLGVRLIDPAADSPGTLVLTDLCADRIGADVEAAPDQAVPWILSSAISLGADPQVGVEAVLRWLRGRRFRFRGEAGGLQDRCPDFWSRPDPPTIEGSNMPDVSADACPRLIDDLRFIQLDGNVVAIHPLNDRPVFFDPSARLLLECCDGHTRVADIVGEAARAFERPLEEVERSFRVLLCRAHQIGLLQEADSPLPPPIATG
jgi:hypothetical protein